MDAGWVFDIKMLTLVQYQSLVCFRHQIKGQKRNKIRYGGPVIHNNISTTQQKQAAITKLAQHNGNKRNTTKLTQHTEISITQQKLAATQWKQATTQRKQATTQRKQATTQRKQATTQWKHAATQRKQATTQRKHAATQRKQATTQRKLVEIRRN